MCLGFLMKKTYFKCKVLEKKEPKILYGFVALPFIDLAGMMGDSVMTSAMLDRLLHHARVFTLDGESHRIKNQNKEE